MRRLLVTYLAICALLYGGLMGLQRVQAGSMLLLGAGASIVAASTCATIIAQVSGIIGCWNADQGVALSGSNVTTWTDQSSNGYVLGLNAAGTQASPVSPVFGASSYNGRAGITCAQASAQYLATTSAAVAINSNTSSFFMAAQFSSSSDSFGRLLSVLYSGNSDDFSDAFSVSAILRSSTNSQVTWFHASAGGTAAGISYNTPTRIGNVFDNANATTFINNSQSAQSALTFTLGGVSGSQIAVCQAADRIVNGTGLLDGVVRRILATNTAVSSGDRGNIDTWLQQ